MRMKPCKPHPDLDALLEQSKGHIMTREEIAAQRKSWVIGEMMLSNLAMTREEAERIYDSVA